MTMLRSALVYTLILATSTAAIAQGAASPPAYVERENASPGPQLALFAEPAAPYQAPSPGPVRIARSRRHTIILVTVLLVGFFLLALAAGRS